MPWADSLVSWFKSIDVSEIASISDILVDLNITLMFAQEDFIAYSELFSDDQPLTAEFVCVCVCILYQR